MTISPVTLPYAKRTWMPTRILVAASWGATWQKLPMASSIRNGYKLLRFSRTCLPDEGTAVFRLPYGKIDGKLFVDTTFGSALSAPDLRQYEVRIQGQLSTGNWKTIWWGQCVAMRDACFPGSSDPSGDIDYHCVDALGRLRRWYLDYHQLYWSGTAFRGRRHPGYNALLGRGDRETTSADPNGLGFGSHAWPGTGVVWTDQQAVEHAIKSSVPGLWDAGTNAGTIAAARALHPTFPLYGSTDWLQANNIYPARDLEDLRTFMTRVFERGRGRGLVFLDWTDDTAADPTSQIAPRLTIRAPVKDDLSVALPGGGTASFVGASNAGTMISLNLVGDHRLGEDAQRTFQVAAASDVEHTGVEVRGDFIIALANLSKKDVSLTGRWLAAEQTDLENASATERELNEAKFDHVYRRYGFPHDWDLHCGDGTNNTRTRVDYRCDAAGTVIQQSDSIASRDTSPLVISIADRLPLYFGYDYTQSPAVTFHGDPPGDIARLPIGVWIRVNDSPERYINGAHRMGMSIARAEQDLQIRCAEDQGGRYRKISDKSIYALSPKYNDDQMVLLVGLQLPERVRLLQGVDGEKTKRITVKDHHLWLAHPGAIVSLDSATSSNGGYAPKRVPVSSHSVYQANPAGNYLSLSGDFSKTIQPDSTVNTTGSANPANNKTYTVDHVVYNSGTNLTIVYMTGSVPTNDSDFSLNYTPIGVLRDDRDRLAVILAEAAVWYLTTRLTGTWTLRDFGWSDGWHPAAEDGSEDTGTLNAWPQLGQLMHQLSYSGRTETLDTPVTRFDYSDETGESTWATSWSDRDWK